VFINGFNFICEVVMSETIQFHGREHWQELEITLDRVCVFFYSNN